MLALQKAAAGPGITLQEVAPPRAAPDEVLIKVVAAGICGTDIHVQQWSRHYTFIEPALPVILGHEFSGEVVEVGSAVRGLSAGARVTVMPSVTCGVCAHCSDGHFDLCTTRKGIGLTRNGAFAPLVAAPARNCIPIPPELDLALAALTEPLTVSAQAVATGTVAAGDRVLVMGPGTIGQGIAVFARLAGAQQVIITGKDDAHRFDTLRRLGFTQLIDVAAPDATERLEKLAGPGFDVVLEATGSPQVIDKGLSLLRQGGVLVMSGIHETAATVDVTRMVRKSLQMRGSYRAPRVTWERVVQALAANPAQFAPMISHRVPLSQATEGFALANRREGSKVLLVP